MADLTPEEIAALARADSDGDKYRSGPRLSDGERQKFIDTFSRTPSSEEEDDDEQYFSWVNDEAVALIERHISGFGYVVKDLDGNWLREPDHFTGGTRARHFEAWGDAYLAAVRIVEAR